MVTKRSKKWLITVTKTVPADSAVEATATFRGMVASGEYADTITVREVSEKK
jgi:hypothetical protein